MKKMDSIGLFLCKYQANLFELSRDNLNCSSKIFIRRFMNSELAKRMDRHGFIYGSLDIKDALNEIEEQYGTSNYGTDKYSAEELHWIGYIYRYWAYTDEKSSKQIYKLMKPDVLRKLYFPYHSLDPLQAIERIKEAYELEDETDEIVRGVMIIRKVRERRKALDAKTS